MRFVVSAYVGLDFLMGLLLLRHAWDNSWSLWSPSESAVWFLEFRPYPTFYPSLLLLVLGVASLASILEDLRRPEMGYVWLRAAAFSHLVLGAGMLAATFAIFSFLFICADPGGCYTEFAPYPPIAIPSALVFAAGLAGALLDRWWDRRGEAPPGVAIEQ